MSADNKLALAGIFKLFDGIAMEEGINSHGDRVRIFDVGFHSKLRLPVKNPLAMLHRDPQRKTKKIAMNLRIEALGDVLLFLIRLGKYQLSRRDKFLHEGSEASESINFDLLQTLTTFNLSSV